MKKITTTAVAALLALTASSSVMARHHHDEGIHYARVVSSTPIYETVRVNSPTRECWDERVVRHGSRSHTGTIAGGILGGVIGNQFGSGSGKTAMTVAGTLLGASVGHDVSRNQRGRDYVDYDRRCEVVDRYETREQLVGYRVKYRFKGETFTTRTEEHPGRRIPIEVSVRPVRSY